MGDTFRGSMTVFAFMGAYDEALERELGDKAAAIQARCHATSSLYLDALLKALNPNVSLELDSFRRTADDYCIESLVLSS